MIIIIIIIIIICNNNKTLDTQFVAPLKYLSNVWISHTLALINCEIQLDLSRSKHYIIIEISRAASVAASPHVNSPVQAREATGTNNAKFQDAFSTF